MKIIGTFAFIICHILILSAQEFHCQTDAYFQNISNLNLEELLNIEAAHLQLELKIDSKTSKLNDVVYRVPIVVHVVYKTPSQNISDAQINSQIVVLNKDFRRTNADASLTPVSFLPFASDANIEYVLATTDPNGQPTNGITRTETDVNFWDIFAAASDSESAEKVKSIATGGIDGWPSDQYLNIWVCNFAAPALGYSTYPGSGGENDGIVIGYKYFGVDYATIYPYNRGRTATHEIGHWLGLFHIWGDDCDDGNDNDCNGSDAISDTPNQACEHYGAPTYPQLDACTDVSPGVMFMNYMDYTNDASMNMFTAGQVDAMRTTLETTRSSILTSIGTSLLEQNTLQSTIMSVSIFPNPSVDFAIVKLLNMPKDLYQFDIIDLNGECISSKKQFVFDENCAIDLSRVPNGYYILKLFSNSINKQCALIIRK